jgi:hypothetical protein
MQPSYFLELDDRYYFGVYYDVWCHLPTYRSQVYSVDIYDAVLEHGIRTPAEFDVYLANRGKPAR